MTIGGKRIGIGKQLRKTGATELLFDVTATSKVVTETSGKLLWKLRKQARILGLAPRCLPDERFVGRRDIDLCSDIKKSTLYRNAVAAGPARINPHSLTPSLCSASRRAPFQFLEDKSGD